MRKIFTSTLFLALLLFAFVSNAQRYVKVPATTDYANPSDLYAAIMGDTLANGNRTDVNTVYQLENGGFYIISDKIVNKPNWVLQIEAENLSDTDNKPVISRIPNASGNYPNILYPEGDMTLKNIWIIVGEKGPLEDHDWGKIHISGENTRIIVKDCLIEKDRGGFIQLRANGVKCYIDKCTFRNGGNRRKVQGNGRVVDAREFKIDSLVVTNSIMYNIHDRIFRSQGATVPHGYIEFDHNTIFNNFGRHGCFQFGQAMKVVVTNNLISNPIMQGTSPAYTDEQTQVDNDAHKVFTIDGTDPATEFTFANNNIFWTQDVLDYYASNDSVSRVEVYSQEIIKKLGGESAAGATYFTEVLELNSVPQRILQLVEDTYADPTSTNMFDIIVEDISRAGTAYDSGNLFDFSTFDAGYPNTARSAKGDTNGKSVGAVPVQAVSIPVRYVSIPPTTDYADPSDIYPVIMGDTTSDGSRVSENTVYLLENGGFYIISDKIVNKPNWALQIEAEDLSDTDNKPVISRIPNASGSYPNILYPEGNMTLKNIWIIAGEKGPLEDHDWGKIRISGENTRIIVKDCLIEKDRGGFIQLRANGVKCYIDKCTFRNGGNRRKVQGNGRIVDAREFKIDSLVVTNSIMYNIHDRIFRSQGATVPHGYIKFDHNTIFNNFGRHGCFQFGQAMKVVVTNNLISNPIMQGTSPVYTDEQTQVDNDAHKVFTIDGTDPATDFTFANNNIFWTQDVLDYYASNDSVSRVEVYSQEIIKKLGGESAAEATYFTEVLELNSVPQRILQLVEDTYADPTSTNMFDIIVEDISRAGTAYDSGNLFDFSTFDAAYNPGSQSAQGDTEGGSVGAIQIVPTSASVIDLDQSNFNVYPNPVMDYMNFEYSVNKAGHVKVSVYDLAGREQLVLVNEKQTKGRMQVRMNAKDKLVSGVYLVKLETASDTSIKKVIIQ